MLQGNLPKTLREALGQKGKEIGMYKSAEEANLYNNSAFVKYSENCQRCVVAYELQRRGYNVMAQPTHENDKWAIINRWRGAFRHAVTDKVGSTNISSSRTTII